MSGTADMSCRFGHPGQHDIWSCRRHDWNMSTTCRRHDTECRRLGKKTTRRHPTYGAKLDGHVARPWVWGSADIIQQSKEIVTLREYDSLENAATLTHLVSYPLSLRTYLLWRLVVGYSVQIWQLACSCLQHCTHRCSEQNTLTKRRTEERGERDRRSDSSQRYASYNIYLDDFWLDSNKNIEYVMMQLVFIIILLEVLLSPAALIVLSLPSSAITGGT